MSECKNPKCWCHHMEQMEKMFEEEVIIPTIKVEIPADYQARIRFIILCAHLEAKEMACTEEYLEFLAEKIIGSLWLN